MLRKCFLFCAAIAFTTLLASARISAGQSIKSDSMVAKADIAHHRTLTPHRINVTHVRSYRDYALAAWEDENTEGEDVFKYRDGAWRFIGGGGGIPAARDLITLYHVPSDVARILTRRTNSRPFPQ